MELTGRDLSGRGMSRRESPGWKYQCRDFFGWEMSRGELPGWRTVLLGQLSGEELSGEELSGANFPMGIITRTNCKYGKGEHYSRVMIATKNHQRH